MTQYPVVCTHSKLLTWLLIFLRNEWAGMHDAFMAKNVLFYSYKICSFESWDGSTFLSTIEQKITFLPTIEKPWTSADILGPNLIYRNAAHKTQNTGWASPIVTKSPFQFVLFFTLKHPVGVFPRSGPGARTKHVIFWARWSRARATFLNGPSRADRRLGWITDSTTDEPMMGQLSLLRNPSPWVRPKTPEFKIDTEREQIF